MKKRILSHLLICIITCILVVPFYISKANTTVLQFANGLFDYGAWTTYYAENNGSYVITDMFDIVNVPMQWESALITKVDLDNVYSGQLTLQLTGNINTNMWEYYVSGNAYSLRTTENNKITLYLTECSQFYIYAFCANNNDTNFTPYQWTGTLEPKLTSTELQIRYKYFPYENLMLYLWSKSYGDFLDYPPTDIPFIKMTNNDQSYTESHHIQIVNGTNDFYILTSQGLSSNRWSIYWRATLDSRVTVTMTQLKGFPNGLYIHRLRIENPGGINYFDLELLSSIYCYPVYYTQGGHIPDNVALLLQTDYNNTYTDLLKEIRDALQTNNNTPTNPSSDLNQANNDLNTVSQNIENFESTITTDFYNNMNNINLNDYNIFTQLSDTSYYFKTYINDLFNHIGDFKALFIVPIIVTVLMLIVGWVI